VTQPSTHAPSQAELDAADDATDSWLMYNKGYRAERYSPLAKINAENAANLHPVCAFQLGEIGTFSTGPVEYDGLLYVTSHLSTYAIDATTCRKVWSHRRLVATAGKEGVLHLVDRDSGQLVFKLPVTTSLNHDALPTPEGVHVCPVAGVQWNGPAHDPASDRLYVNAIDWCTLFKLGPAPNWSPMVPYTGLANGFGTNDPVSQSSGWINAIDPKTGQFVWRVHRPTPMYAAVTATAGNVLFTGDLNGDFLVLNAGNGQELYSFNTGGPMAGGVITYERGGKQYVAAATGNSGGSIPLKGSPTVMVFGE
jgi:glucose dehydrogenase